MGCRKLRLEMQYGKAAVALVTNGYIPCPYHRVIHTPEGDREINIKEEKKDEA